MPFSQDPIDMEQVQGNILGGFLKDHQVLLFLAFGTVPRAKAWLAQLEPQLATSAEVLAFNALHSSLRTRYAPAPPPISATWINLALTPDGIKQLAPTDLAALPAEFTADLSDRAVSVCADPPASQWITGLQHPESIDAVLIVAADDPADLLATLDRLAPAMDDAGIREVHREHGDVRADQPGHEHFGYKDGISQPVVNTGPPPYTDTDNPWRFLVSAAAPVTPPSPPQPGQPGYDPSAPTPPPTPAPVAGFPQWAHLGSFGVYRRLHQDVAGFQDWVDKQPDGFDDSLIGRADDGTPLDPAGEAAVATPDRNNWTFGDDPGGTTTPLAAHIRKTNPRDGYEVTHRLLRRGIAYGPSFRHGSADGSPGSSKTDRGLQFLCYQASIVEQFEFVQQSWADNDEFPVAGAGVDPVIRQVAKQHMPIYRSRQDRRSGTKIRGNYGDAIPLSAVPLRSSCTGDPRVLNQGRRQYSRPSR